jgi:putative phosphoesterase
MLIGVISDTHDRTESMQNALEFFSEQGVELILHCGDWKTVDTAARFAMIAERLSIPAAGVLGNNDTDVDGFIRYAATAPGDFALHAGVLELTVDNIRLVVYHGHHKPTLRKLHDIGSQKVLILGHSHKPFVGYKGAKLIVNPGSTAFSIPRSREWRPSVAILNTQPLAAEIHYL